MAEAKAEVVDSLPPGGTAVVPASVLELEPFLRRGDVRYRRFGDGGDAQVVSFSAGEGGAVAEFEIDGELQRLELAITARYQATNTLAALLAFEALGFALESAKAGAAHVTLSPGRGEERRLPGGGLLINDAYNANPISMRAALEHLAERAAGRRRVAVLGEMAELGPEAPRYHREVGEVARAVGVEVLLTVGPLATEYLAAGVAEGRAARDAEEAARVAAEVVRDGDCVLVKGSRSVGLEVVADALTAAPAQRGFASAAKN